MPEDVADRAERGPPAACPTASAWPLIESTVARTLESVICWFSQIDVERRQQSRARNTRAAPTIATRRRPGRARRRASPTSSSERRARRATARDQPLPAALEALDRARRRDEAEHHRDEPRRSRTRRPDRGRRRRQADVAQEVRLLEPVERLARQPHEERDADQQQEHAACPGVPRAGGGGRPQLGEREPRSARGRRRKPVSGMRKMHASAAQRS